MLAEQHATIVVAEDSDRSRMEIVARLEAAGYQVNGVHNGSEVIKAIAAGSVDLVLLDVMMPVLDGYETLRLLRQTHRAEDLPVIMLTARSGPDDIVHALRLGANDYAVKPVETAVLLARIATHLKLAQSRDVRLGPYELLGRVGAGGMGIVYEARHTENGSPVAIKVLSRSLTVDPVNVKRFLLEAELCRRVEHPQIVRLFEVGQEGETHFIVMELVRGHDLSVLARGHPLPIGLALEVGLQLADALDAINRHGILHRDIKPQNIMLTPGGTVKLTDFGVARDKQTDGEITNPGVSVGSPCYSSIEQLCGKAEHRSDIYSLGCTIHFLLTGQPPFPTDSPTTDVVELKMGPPPSVRQLRPEVPTVVDEILRSMMACRVSDRPRSCEPVKAALRHGLEQHHDPDPTSLRRWYQEQTERPLRTA